jgi:hypothetical protein
MYSTYFENVLGSGFGMVLHIDQVDVQLKDVQFLGQLFALLGRQNYGGSHCWCEMCQSVSGSNPYGLDAS